MDNRKLIVTSYIAVSILTWFLSRSFVAWLKEAFNAVRRFPPINTVKEAVPVLIALTAFVVLIKTVKVNTFMDEVVLELKKVTWPGREDVVRATTVVLICITIASLILAFFDLLWGRIISSLLS